jgi:hypothetical protein
MSRSTASIGSRIERLRLNAMRAKQHIYLPTDGSPSTMDRREIPLGKDHFVIYPNGAVQRAVFDQGTRTWSR